MLQHIVYICGATQFDLARHALERMRASEVGEAGAHRACYILTHKLLGSLKLQVNVLSDLDIIGSHLRENPVDLLIYDERGEGAVPALRAIQRIRADVQALADSWGPDFNFPMSRVVAILGEKGKSRRVFELGRMNVRDVCTDPKSLSALLLWLKDVLWHGILREQKIGVTLGGGGIEGFLYEIGVLAALEGAFEEGTSLRKCDVISGVSSGAIAGALFASKIPIHEVIKSLRKRSGMLPPLTSSTIFDLAATDISKRFLKQGIAWKGLDPKRWIDMTLKSVPTGFFKGERMEEYIRTALEVGGHKDSFDDIEPELLIGATNADSFEHVTFGCAPHDKVAISEAIRASVALPPVFLPKKIGKHWYIDGQVTKSCDLDMVVERGCRLVVVVNPLKPFASHIPGMAEEEGGLFSTIQTIKALVSTRFEQTLKSSAERYPDVDFIVFEPDEECAELMAGSPMRYRIRTQLIRMAFSHTLRKLRERHHVYAVKFGKYGLNLRSAAELKKLESDYAEIFESTT